jgi:hypothetical protein
MHRNSPFRAGRAALALVLSLGAGMALSTTQAATVTWNGNASNGLWFDAGNWSGGSGVPGAADDAVFGAAATGTVSLGGGTAQVASVVLDSATGLNLANGSVNANSFSQTGGSNALRVNLGVQAMLLGTSANLTIADGAVVNIETTLTGQLNALLTVQAGAQVSAPSVDLLFTRVNVDGEGSRLQLTGGTVNGLTELYLRSGGVLGCIGSAATLTAQPGTSFDINIGEGGPPGRIDCQSLAVNLVTSGTPRIRLFHNQNDYRLERPNGQPISLNGDLGLTASFGVRTILPGAHGYTGPTSLSNDAALELQGELTGSDVSLQSGTILRGNGRVHGNVTAAANAVIAPGAFNNAQPGSLRFGSMDLVDQTQLRFDLSEPGTVGSPNDLIVVDGDASIDGGRVFIETLGDVGRYRLFNVGGTVTGGLVLQAVPAGFDLADWQIARTGGQIDLVPPATLEIDPVTLALNAPEGGQDEGSVTLRNVGSSDLNVTQVDPPSDARFTRQPGSCGAGAFTLPPDASCTLVYRFASAQPGGFSSSILVRSFPQAAGNDVLTLQGTATRLPPQLSPALIGFGTVGVGETSTPQQASLFNPSSAALAIDDIDLASGMAFGIPGTTCGASLAGNTGCTVDLVFQPLAAGAASDTLRVVTAAGELGLDMQGEGFSPLIFRSGFEG